jgi:hypothetical protein
MRRMALVLGLAAVSWSCPLTIEPADSSVGAGCSEDRDCAVGYCETKMTGGYCTVPCDTLPCPAGSRCIELAYPMFPRVAYCHRSCVRHEDCGRSGYVCVVPMFSKGSETACMPAN